MATEAITATITAGSETITHEVVIAARGPASSGGTTLTSYASQVATLPDYPTTFPNDDVTAATSAATPSKIAKRDAQGGIAFSGLTLTDATLTSNGTGDFTIASTGSGTITINSGSGLTISGGDVTISAAIVFSTNSYTFGVGAAVAFFAALVNGNESTARTELGLTVTGDALATAATPLAARSVMEEKLYIDANDSATRNNDTYADDDILKDIPLDANSKYEIVAFVVMACTAASGYKMLLSSGGALDTVVATFYGTISSPAAFAQYSWASSTGLSSAQTRSSGAATAFVYQIRIEIATTTARTLALRWAQNTTDAAQTATRKGGSWIKTKKLN